MNGNIMQIISEHRKKLCKKVNSYNPNLVIDVGCGPFWSKSHNKIKNVIGFDRENWTKRPDVFALPDLLCTIEEADKIFKGEDPKEQIKSDLLKLQLGDAIRKYYQEELTSINQYRPSTIKGIKGTFGPWIFRNTYEKDILQRTERVEDLQYKKLSSITPKMFKNL